MTKIISMFLLFTMSLSITACSNGSKDEAKNKDEIKAVKEQSDLLENNVLVVCFSATGKTRKVAENVAAILEGDIYEIIPRNPYTDEDLTYYTNGRADREQEDSKSRPEIMESEIDIDKYETIILGYPIWHGQAPRIVSTFLESHDFKNKTILPFCTAHSSDIGTSAKNLQLLTPDSTTWLEGKRLAETMDQADIDDWLIDIKETNSN